MCEHRTACDHRPPQPSENPAMSRFLLALLLAVSSPLAFAQAQKAPAPAYEPSVGQEGKDVVWVPTPQVVVDKMLDMAKVTKDDFVMDLGSGDGRTVITAAKRGARALGVEYNPEHGRALEAQRGEGRRERAGAVRQGRPLRDRFLEGDGDHHVPAARYQPQAAPEDPQPQARHAHRLQHLHHGRLESRRDRGPRRRRQRQLQRVVVHRAALDRAGQGRRHPQAAAGRAAR